MHHIPGASLPLLTSASPPPNPNSGKLWEIGNVGREAATLNRVVRENLTEKVSLEPIFEGDERMSHDDVKEDRMTDSKEKESRLWVCLIHHLHNYPKVHTIRFPKESMKLNLIWTACKLSELRDLLWERREAFLQETDRQLSFPPLAILACLKLLGSILARQEWDLQRSWNFNDVRSRGIHPCWMPHHRA